MTHEPTPPELREPSEWRVRPTRARDGVVIERYQAPDYAVLLMRCPLRRDTGLEVAPRDQAVSVPVFVLEWALAELAALK